MESKTQDKPRVEELTLAEDIRDVVADRKLTFQWNAAIDTRLDQLVARARTMMVERSELLAAILAAAPESERDLEELVRDWRQAQVKDVLVDPPPGEETVAVPRPGPGRRGRKGST